MIDPSKLQYFTMAAWLRGYAEVLDEDRHRSLIFKMNKAADMLDAVWAKKEFNDGYEKGVAGFMQAVELEREACAKILDANAMACHTPIMRSLLQANAQAIRARGQA